MWCFINFIRDNFLELDVYFEEMQVTLIQQRQAYDQESLFGEEILTTLFRLCSFTHIAAFIGMVKLVTPHGARDSRKKANTFKAVIPWIPFQEVRVSLLSVVVCMRAIACRWWTQCYSHWQNSWYMHFPFLCSLLFSFSFSIPILFSWLNDCQGSPYLGRQLCSLRVEVIFQNTDKMILFS